jgi:hypothetical protein
MKEEFVTYARDSFGRCDLVRKLVVTSDDCAWCGRYRHKAGKPTGKLFQYGVFNDDAPFPFFYTEFFCSVDCMRTYYFG